MGPQGVPCCSKREQVNAPLLLVRSQFGQPPASQILHRQQLHGRRDRPSMLASLVSFTFPRAGEPCDRQPPQIAMSLSARRGPTALCNSAGAPSTIPPTRLSAPRRTGGSVCCAAPEHVTASGLVPRLFPAE